MWLVYENINKFWRGGGVKGKPEEEPELVEDKPGYFHTTFPSSLESIFEWDWSAWMASLDSSKSSSTSRSSFLSKTISIGGTGTFLKASSIETTSSVSLWSTKERIFCEAATCCALQSASLLRWPGRGPGTSLDHQKNKRNEFQSASEGLLCRTIATKSTQHLDYLKDWKSLCEKVWSHAMYTF